jgi:hypothetical protein
MPLIWLTLFFVSGILISGQMPIKATVWVGIAVLSILAGVISHLRPPVYPKRFPVPAFFPHPCIFSWRIAISNCSDPHQFKLAGKFQ